ncbi:hypothetical protein GCM10027429_17450 [Marivirga atlantica]|uniref:YtxH domain-containing protein n=1 Tax=Marivirga atlantica TaxID=1548457 RepID=A0A937AER6_9BACT|nr:hypothetical protein [Marivirga atlantica]MBL0765361.1 hypothetical protein [Marivirga atlantica]
MSTASKSFVTFLAGAAAATAAAIFLKSENGRKVKDTVSDRFRKNVRGIRDVKSPDWMDELGDSARTTTKKFKERIGL